MVVFISWRRSWGLDFYWYCCEQGQWLFTLGGLMMYCGCQTLCDYRSVSTIALRLSLCCDCRFVATVTLIHGWHWVEGLHGRWDSGKVDPCVWLGLHLPSSSDAWSWSCLMSLYSLTLCLWLHEGRHVEMLIQPEGLRLGPHVLWWHGI